ncbi:MAG: UDP-N-acetylmuramoyl-tripeptide--D-alanyl-D-alanine ligase [Bacteroidales bacterium]|jgi:UDP-N-acetylmuramoyl-tripeptide--D-alanyl-D-alanine ligase|nr:UDP-N-acetylmuramoyl-tripeptide--D-alanyl-D-alanine ligase [Bacteroidales bacterium]
MGLFFYAVFIMSVQDFYNNIFCDYPLVTTDTRSIPENSVFFALKGERFNGNNFALQALNNGAAFAVVDDCSLKHSQLICVDDVLIFLQKLALHHRRQLQIPIIGITGSNGKTTMKELIAAVLLQKYEVSFTQGNLNNHIGVPLTLLAIPKSTEIAIVEMGANHPGEIAFLCSLVEPNYGIITNIGRAHMEGFGAFENIINTKVALYDSVRNNSGIVFVDADNELLCSHIGNMTTVKYSLSEDTNSLVTAVPDSHNVCASFRLQTSTSTTEISSQLFGEYNMKNMLAAATIGYHFDVDIADIKKGLEGYIPSNNRSQIVETETNTIILDAYNANPSSVKSAVEYFLQVDNEMSKVLILGEMYELGEFAVEEHQAIQRMVLESSITQFFCVGNWPFIDDSRYKIFANTGGLYEYLEKYPLRNCFVLVKGSRAVALEKIVPVL